MVNAALININRSMNSKHTGYKLVIFECAYRKVILASVLKAIKFAKIIRYFANRLGFLIFRTGR
ncbi:hypothetical protein V5J35_003769 [Endozoicomonas sp. NE40]|uniref:Uncharacterized protein n=1 Tax=Endozoicomonas lisbonensis TaxID=3120522 RepID=A0ABV2SLC8_9GAMM